MVAVFASTQVAPVAEAVRQRAATGRPVRGSSRWWRGVPALVQVRASVLLVASPPRSTSTTSRCSSSPLSVSWTPTGHPAGACAASGSGADRDVAAEADEHAGAGSGGREPCGDIAGEGLARRAQVQGRAVRHAEAAVGMRLDLAPGPAAGRLRQRGRPEVVPAELGEVAVVPGGDHGPPERRVDQAVGGPRSAQGRVDGSHQQRVHVDDPAGSTRSPGRGRCPRGNGCRCGRRGREPAGPPARPRPRRRGRRPPAGRRCPAPATSAGPHPSGAASRPAASARQDPEDTTGGGAGAGGGGAGRGAGAAAALPAEPPCVTVDDVDPPLGATVPAEGPATTTTVR